MKQYSRRERRDNPPPLITHFSFLAHRPEVVLKMARARAHRDEIRKKQNKLKIFLKGKNETKKQINDSLVKRDNGQDDIYENTDTQNWATPKAHEQSTNNTHIARQAFLFSSKPVVEHTKAFQIKSPD